MSDAVVEAVGGAVGSVLAVGVTYPLTTISTWQALDHKQGAASGGDGGGDGSSICSAASAEGAENAVATAAMVGSAKKQQEEWLPSPLRELVHHSRTRGWGALFAGVRPCLAATAVSQGAYFYLYSALRQAVAARVASRSGAGTGHRGTDIGIAGSLLVAGAAGAVNVLLTNPVWVVAMQVLANGKSSDEKTRKLTAAQTAARLYAESGVGGFWKGLVPALAMVVNPTLQYVLYEWLTARLMELRRRRVAKARLATSDVFALTALAKCGATLVTYPMLLIKSRLQAATRATDAGARYSGVADATATILRSEGFRGFFKGMQIKMIQTVLSAALLMSIKENVYVATRAALRSAPSRAG